MTNIEWAKNADGSQGKTWNPIVGCAVVSPGCTNCYAMRMAARLGRMGQDRYAGLTRPTKAGPVWTGETRLVEGALTLPLRTRKTTTWFVNSMSDLFAESVPDAWIDRVFAVMALCPQHTFQVLTKRSARMRAYCNDPRTPGRIARVLVDETLIEKRWSLNPDRWPVQSIGDENDPADLTIAWPLPNCWKGVSAEDRRRADERVPDLLATPAAVRFVSAEPLLGPIDFESIACPEGCYPPHYCNACHPDGGAPKGSFDALQRGLDWIIVGGESGPGARPMHPDWARGIRDQCEAAGVAFFFKQHGAWAPGALGPGWMLLDREGGLDIPDDRAPDEEDGEVAVTLVGKARAGRLLDGRTWDQMPEVRYAV